MKTNITIRNQSFSFDGLYDLMAKANEVKSGDQLAGLAADSDLERIAAKTLLADVSLNAIYETPAVPYECDEVTRAEYDALDMDVYAEIKTLSVGELRERILSEANRNGELQRLGRGLTGEMAAAAAKLMSNLDLVYAAQKISVQARCLTEIGQPDVLACRLQPNHPADSIDGILASTKEGLSYGAGDALIGVNPVDDGEANITRIMNALSELAHDRLKVPTQTCVLAHIATQMSAISHGARTDVLFQSLAGTQGGNESFGISASMLKDGYDLMQSLPMDAGPNRMYFETGQGSELSADAHEGIDQQTLEARCYALARNYQPFMVNSVVGFIGPEYLYDARQITRAGLEDHFMGKLMGLPMGLDVCYTNHCQADQNDLETLAALLTGAGVNFFMGVPMGGDIMLNYQTTSFHDIAALRETFKRSPAPAFQAWLEDWGFYQEGRLSERAGDASVFDATEGRAA